MKEQLQLERLVRDIEKSFGEAWDVFADYEYALTSRQDQEYYEEPLHDHVKSIYVRLQFAYEILGLAGLLSEMRGGFGAHQESLTAIAFTATGHPYSPSLDYLGTYFRPLKASVPSLVGADAAAALQQLERILRGTPKLLKDRNLEPKNEKEIRQAVYDTLIHFYPDTVREVPIAKQSKVYKPDIGVPTLKAAIEYKFVDSEAELKTALGGIYEDVGGYAGSEDWTTFFAIIYITDNFLTQAQVDAEFKMSKVDRAWRPILVPGRGARKKAQA